LLSSVSSRYVLADAVALDVPEVPVVDVALGDDVTFVSTNFVLVSAAAPVVPVVPVAV
jgi:hypothetical protein